MMLYLFEWCNGLGYDDYEVSLMGVYTSAERREQGKQYYNGCKKEIGYPFNDKGYWVECEVEADKDFMIPDR